MQQLAADLSPKRRGDGTTADGDSVTGGLRSTIQIKPHIIFPVLDDSKKGLRDVEDFFMSADQRDLIQNSFMHEPEPLRNFITFSVINFCSVAATNAV